MTINNTVYNDAVQPSNGSNAEASSTPVSLTPVLPPLDEAALLRHFRVITQDMPHSLTCKVTSAVSREVVGGPMRLSYSMTIVSSDASLQTLSSGPRANLAAAKIVSSANCELLKLNTPLSTGGRVLAALKMCITKSITQAQSSSSLTVECEETLTLI